MRTKVNIARFPFYCTFISLLAVIITSCIGGFLGIPVSTKQLGLAAATANIVLYIFYLYPVSIVAAAVGGAIWAGGSFLITKGRFLSYMNKVYSFIYNSILWFIKFLFESPSMDERCAAFIMITIAVIITFILFILIVRRRLGIFAIVSGITAISVMWMFSYNQAINYLKQYVFVSFLLYGFLYYEKMELKWKEQKDRYSKGIVAAWLGCTAIIGAFVLLVTATLPQDIKAVDIEWLNDTVFSRISDAWYSNSSTGALNGKVLRERYDMTDMGFQNDSSLLGGPVKTDNKPQLKVKVEGNISAPIYLRGNIKDTYTGNSWSESSLEQFIRYENDSEIRTDADGDDSRVKERTWASITVYPQALRTTTMFNIWKPESAAVYNKSFSSTMGGGLYQSRTSNKTKPYTVVSNVPEVYADELRKGFIYKRYGGMENYLQLPEKLPGRVRDEAFRITRQSRNTFDVAEALQNYLRDKYPYTLETAEVPQDRDFVDHFLFDERKGYCTYFASAMVVMSRINGIPARYVEGFVLRDSDIDSDGFYVAKSENAHAWAELYFDGYGWVQFEATPAYWEIDYGRPVTTSTGTDTKPQEPSVTPTPQENTNKGQELEDPETGSHVPGADAEKDFPEWLAAAIAFILLIVTSVVMKILLSRRALEKADRLQGEDAAEEYFTILEKKLRRAGAGRADSETVHEYAMRMSSTLSGYGIDIKGVSSNFDSVRYGRKEVDPKMREKFKEAIRNADEFVRVVKGNFKYCMIKYLF